MLAILASMFFVSCQTIMRMPDGRRVWSAKASPAILGENVLVIFMPDDWPPRLSENEQEVYAMWSSMLEEYVKRNRCIKEIRRQDFRSADEVFYGHGLPVNEFTLIFIRGDNMALFAREPVLEGSTYDYADAFFKGKEADFMTTSVLHAGEQEAVMPGGLKLVKIRAALTANSAPPAEPAPAPALVPEAPAAAPQSSLPAPAEITPLSVS